MRKCLIPGSIFLSHVNREPGYEASVEPTPAGTCQVQHQNLTKKWPEECKWIDKEDLITSRIRSNTDDSHQRNCDIVEG